MSFIHPTAQIDALAQIDPSVSVGPYAVIGPHVCIGAGSSIGAHCVIEGHTRIGHHNKIFQFCSIGAAPQDKKYAGEPTLLEIGDGNTIREFCTLNTGTAQDVGVTRLGRDNWIMAYVHIAHDCQVGNHTILANATQLGGHVHVGDWAVLGGLTGVHQFTRIGAHAMTGFSTRLSQDLPPYMMAVGNPAEVSSFNQEGLRRRGFTAERLAVVKQMYRALYRQGLTLDQSKAEIAALRRDRDRDATQVGGMQASQTASPIDADIVLLLNFLESAARGIVR